MRSNIPIGGNIPPGIRAKKHAQPMRLGINLGFGSINARPMQKKEATFKLHTSQAAPKEAQEKIPIETLKSWVIDELSFLKEEKGKIDFCNGKAKLLLDFLPEIFRDEILKLFGGQDET